ncbi:MAG: hypothetical protein WD044_03280 [Dongiaceae bacterium]
MNDADGSTAQATTAYEANFRRKGFALAALGLLVLAMFAVIALALIFIEDGNDSIMVILVAVGIVVVGMFVVLAASFRVHRWTIEPNGLRIDERPKVPLMGVRRNAFVTFVDIAALRNLESGFDLVVELGTRDGTVYRLMEPRLHLGTAAAPTGLAEFAAALSKAAAGRGATPLPVVEALSFWNRPGGFAALGFMLLLTIGLAIATAFALFDGGLEARARSGEAIAIFLLLPFGVLYLIHKSLKRRQRVLRGIHT